MSTNTAIIIANRRWNRVSNPAFPKQGGGVPPLPQAVVSSPYCNEVCGKQIQDANIVAVMAYHGVSRLATFNQVDFRRYQDIVLEPLPSTSDVV